ncbi:KamA family radical SAM protein [Anaeromyxobacter paludicola]|uniref:Lysine 2,3-aminomutase n=1 Tax=Anaeromyxobacter paludicola TaxID=2918171 RepID=A0ABN6N1X4_9BACT|nr:KamA family radical SAM protein [Anaeromyxobacter paludicola]BDG07056.1 lysine 2,3-aminomutase [Anaeromyxobacter paludicola]
MNDWRERFPGVAEAEWRDWRWQQRHALRTPEALARLFPLTEAERRGLELTRASFRLGVTPYYASLIDADHPSCPIRRQAIPVAAEAAGAPGDLRDPLGEDAHRPARSVVHKYRDRVLFLAGDTCSVYCRHCTRRRITGGEEGGFDRSAMEEGVAYVRAHPEVRDVLVSGGDPLVLADERLEWLLGLLREVPHVQILRLATRAPVTNPMRVTPELARLLRRFAPLFVVTHFNHAKECTPDAAEACGLLVDAGVPVENQSVLLRGVNSTARNVRTLNEKLLTFRVRPYYLHQGDLAEGTGHLRTPLSCGLGILEELRGRTSGLAIPHLAVDLPGGLGKVTVQPSWLLGRADAGGADAGGHWFRSYEGRRAFYPDPPEADCGCPYDAVFYGDDA